MSDWVLAAAGSSQVTTRGPKESESDVRRSLTFSRLSIIPPRFAHYNRRPIVSLALHSCTSAVHV